jgi:hypothetical protein
MSAFSIFAFILLFRFKLKNSYGVLDKKKNVVMISKYGNVDSYSIFLNPEESY